jgi:hypothetical protein
MKPEHTTRLEVGVPIIVRVKLGKVDGTKREGKR